MLHINTSIGPFRKKFDSKSKKWFMLFFFFFPTTISLYNSAHAQMFGVCIHTSWSDHFIEIDWLIGISNI